MGDKKRVVITGMATINPLGDNLEDYYNNLIAGKSGIKRWESLDVEKLKELKSCQIAGDMGDYDFNKVLEDLKDKFDEKKYKKIKKLFRNMTFSNKSGTVTAIWAFMDAGLLGTDYDPYRVSVLVGGHNLNTKYVAEQYDVFQDTPEWMDPLYGVESIDPNVPGTICEVLGAQGPSYTVGAACASGNIALRDGFRDIVTGECDIAVINGPIWDMGIHDVHAMAYLDSLVTDPKYQDKPTLASRPFDVDRSGFVPSHGAGCLILEDLEHAKARGAKIYAEVLAVAANSNANHLPAPSDVAQANLMRTLFKMADIRPEDVQYVSCHATGTPLGDVKELSAIKNAYGEHAYKLKVNAPKSMLGHTCWAAPIVETIGAVLQMHHGKVHATININELAPEIDLDVCKDGPVDLDINIFMKNSFGFGGLNCCSLIKKYEE